MGNHKNSENQAKDTGQALVLISLLLYVRLALPWLLGVSVVLLLVNMVRPQVFNPIAPLWFGLGEGLGKISSVILLSLVFFLVVTPIGFLMRLRRHDGLKLQVFKKAPTSAMITREHEFTAKDLENAF
jgi:hypothetical protein